MDLKGLIEEIERLQELEDYMTLIWIKKVVEAVDKYMYVGTNKFGDFEKWEKIKKLVMEE